MGWAQAITAGAGLVNSYLNKKGADAQGNAAQAGMDYTKGIYNDAQGNFQPYMDAGQNGLNGLNMLASGNYSGFENSPDYLYARSQAQYGVDHSAAARGSLYSGGHNLDLANAMNGIASQNLGNYRNSLMGMANMGQNSAAQLGQIGTNAAAGVRNSNAMIGDAKATSYGAIGGGLTGLAGQFNNYYNGGGSSSYGGGSSASSFGLPYASQPYDNTYWGQS